MKVKDICEVYSGYAIKHFNDTKAGFPVIKIGNINNDCTLNFKSYQFTTDNIDKKYFSKKEDIYIALSGATTGKVAIFDANEKYIVNQRVGIIRKRNNLVPAKYILYFLLAKTDKILQDAMGCAQPNISPIQIGSYDMKDYTIEKIKEIASVLDKLQSIISLRKEQLAKLDELVKARFVEMFGDVFLNSKNYPIKFLSDIAKYWNGLTYSPDNVSNTGTVVLRSSNIQNSALDFSDIVRVNCKISDNKIVRENDILMCSRNGSAKLVGKVALIKELKEPMSFGAFMMIIRSDYYPYLLTYFQMPLFRKQIATGATTTINQITGNMLDKVKLPVPNRKDVLQFADFVKQVDKSKVAVQKALDKTQLLFDSLMQEYFG